MILHLVDDEKVINRAIDFFEMSLPKQNLFLCFCHKNEGNLYSPKHVGLDTGVIFYDSRQDEPTLPFKDISLVVAHSLGPNQVSFIDRYVPESSPVCWLLWGYDMYSRILYGAGYPLYPLCNSHQPRRDWIHNRVKRLMGYRSPQSRNIIEFVRRRITSVGCCDCDYDLLKNYGVIDDLPRVTYNYYPIEDVLGSMMGKSLANDADVIMCGNSASEAGNHEYVFKHLHRLGIGQRRVVVPLSYCGASDYKERIVLMGNKLFGKQFEPLLDFLPLDKYNELFVKAGICIYGSWRQMAIGNILVALYMGAKVYLSKHNPWLKDAQKAGYKIFVLERATRKTFYEPLSSQDKARNRQLVEASCSSEGLIEMIKSQFAPKVII